MTGKKFGRLTALRRVGTNKDGRPLWLFKCDCGNEHTVNGKDVRTGHSKSCGCYASDLLVKRNYKHGHTKHANVRSPEYKTWIGMRKRIFDKTYHAYDHYKKRGITICDRWNDKNDGFKNFYTDMGTRPGTEYTLERIDNDKGYSPDNCKWATMAEQTNNRENTIYAIVDGEKDTLANWARRKGLNYMKFYRQVIRLGVDPDKAIAKLTKDNL